MHATDTHTDRHGQPIAVGDEVRIINIEIGTDIDDDEREMFEFMRGAVCEIDYFDEEGRAWVTMWWNTGEGNATTSVGLASRDLERVSRTPAT
ncbi:MAG: hypothetical protein Q7J47_03435 [Azoarcus sp.]|nr:hypothetical protein [Azoarcus sp.]